MSELQVHDRVMVTGAMEADRDHADVWNGDMGSIMEVNEMTYKILLDNGETISLWKYQVTSRPAVVRTR